MFTSKHSDGLILYPFESVVAVTTEHLRSAKDFSLTGIFRDLKKGSSRQGCSNNVYETGNYNFEPAVGG